MQITIWILFHTFLLIHDACIRTTYVYNVWYGWWMAHALSDTWKRTKKNDRNHITNEFYMRWEAGKCFKWCHDLTQVIYSTSIECVRSLIRQLRKRHAALEAVKVKIKWEIQLHWTTRGCNIIVIDIGIGNWHQMLCSFLVEPLTV